MYRFTKSVFSVIVILAACVLVQRFNVNFTETQELARFNLSGGVYDVSLPPNDPSWRITTEAINGNLCANEVVTLKILNLGKEIVIHDPRTGRNVVVETNATHQLFSGNVGTLLFDYSADLARISARSGFHGKMLVSSNLTKCEASFVVEATIDGP